MSDTLIDLDWDTLLDDGDGDDPENYAHIIRRHSPEIGAEAVIALAVATGQFVVALCGWKWLPKGLAPDNLPACPKCTAEWSKLA